MQQRKMYERTQGAKKTLFTTRRFAYQVGLPLLCLSLSHNTWAISFEEAPGPFAETEAWGSSWGDFNNDRCPDLFVNHHREEAALYKNNCDGTFKDITFKVDVDKAWLDDNELADQHGASWADVDSDGDQDLYITTGARWDGVYMINEGGVLRNRTAFAGLKEDREGRMPLWVDYNNNRLLDLVMQSRTRSWTLQQNQRDGTYWDSNQFTGFNVSDTINLGNLIDLDGDGTLEYIGSPEGTFPTVAFDMRQQPFRDITANIPQVSFVLDTAVGDFDGDLMNDLVLVRGRIRRVQSAIFNNDTVETWFTTSPGDSDKTVRFKSTGGDLTIDMYSFLGEVRYYFGAEGYHPGDETRINSTTFAFSLDADDPANHGIKPHNASLPEDQGVYVGYDPVAGEWEFSLANGGDYTTAYFVVKSTAPVSDLEVVGVGNIDLPQPPIVLRTNGNGYSGATVPLSEMTDLGDLSTPVTCNSAAAGDFDNDMDQDIYMVCSGGVENIPNILYENLGNGQFRKVPSAGGAAGLVGASVSEGRSIADSVTLADYDGDGKLDMFVTNGVQLFPVRFPSPDQLFRNTTRNNNSWVELDLVGTLSNRDGIGAKIYATAGGKTQLREQNTGQHRWSQNFQRIHFGLARNDVVDIRVEWPSGLVDTYENVAANRLYRVTEDGPIVPVQLGPVAPDPGGDIPADNVEVLRAVYTASTQSIWVRATSDVEPAGSAQLLASARTGVDTQDLGLLTWNATASAYQKTFTGLTVAPDCITVASASGGTGELAVEGTGSCDDGGGTPTDKISVVQAVYFQADQRLWIRATSDVDPVGSDIINASMVFGAEEIPLGQLGWKTNVNYYQQAFTGIALPPDRVILTNQNGVTVTAGISIQ